MPWLYLLVEWILKVLRRLWADRGEPLSVLLRKITWQKVFFAAVLLIAAYAFAQVFSLDLAFLMAGDVAFYCEIAAAIMFMTVRGHVRQSVHTARLELAQVMRRARIWYRQLARARGRRNTKVPAVRDKGADDDGGWLPQLQGFALQP
jgi:hypothetical protein